MKTPYRLPIALLPALLLACDPVEDGGGGNGDPAACPASLPEATVGCTGAACSATTGTKTFGMADLKADTGNAWVVVTWATSEVASANENTNVQYTKAASGALVGARRTSRVRRDPVVDAIAYAPERVERLDFERSIRSHVPARPFAEQTLLGTAIRGRTSELLPAGAHKQQMNCDAATPKSCGATMLCVIPQGMTSGTCESALTMKFQGTQATARDVAATVRKVGDLVAVVVDDADTVSDGDVDELVRRFDMHIGPRMHQFFGEPKNASGKDRDSNGVVIMFLTSKVSEAGNAVVGFFLAQDLEDTANNANSNAADLLYLRPPGGSISLDALSGTMAHEYQHLINYYAKVIRGGSSQEERWLDEGLATFAEDVAGYGQDSFKNVFAYLQNASDTSLTGFGLIAGNETEADGFERRGMGHLMVRTIFERAGGATFPDGPGVATDAGGVAAIRAIVATDDTGIDALTTGGRNFPDLMKNLLLTVAIDGTALACLPKYDFAEPAADAFTGIQRGLDLRKTITVPGSADIPLNGPAMNTLENEEVPFPINGGEFRTVAVPSGGAAISVGGPADATIGFTPYATR